MTDVDSGYYDRQGNPITLEQWHELSRPWVNGEGARRVAATQVGEEWVSTVWLGLDHSFGHGPPVIFETMIFEGPHDDHRWRYCTEAEALAGHEAVVAALRSGFPLPD